MRMPRIRLSIRRTMVLVALAAVPLWINSLILVNRGWGDRNRCRPHLRELALTLNYYRISHGSFPPGTQEGRGLPSDQRLSWVSFILPWTDYSQGIRYRFEVDRPWDAPENRLPAIELSPVGGPIRVVPSTSPPEFPPALSCPSNHTVAALGMPEPFPYVGIAGLGVDAPSLPVDHWRAGVFGCDRRTRLEDIRDGASSTMLLAETTHQNGPWTAGGFSTMRGLDPARRPYIGPGRQFGGAHRGAAMVAFADGSVRFVRDTIDPGVFEALSTIAGGERLPASWGE